MPIKACVFDAYGTLYDVQSVCTAIEEAFPGHGDLLTQIWRLKQLEYAWLRCIMDDYVDFRVVTQESLSYTLRLLGLPETPATLDRLVDAYNHLTPYPDADAALATLKHCRRAILSNGSQAMLDALVKHSGLARHLDAVISVDAVRAFKPDRRVYALLAQRLGVEASEVLFVTSNGFDVAGARAYGFQVARVVRVAPETLRQEMTGTAPIGAATLYRALRSQNEVLGQGASLEVPSLLDLAHLPQLQEMPA